MEKHSRIRLKDVYKVIIVGYLSLLIISNVFLFNMNTYILLGISIMVVFFSRRNIDPNYIRSYMFIILFALYGMIVALANGGGIGGPITIITGLMVCYAVQQIELNKKDIVVIAFVCIVSITYWLIKSPTYYDLFFYNHWKGDGSLTNANGVGHFLAYEGSFLFIILSFSKKKWINRLKWIIGIACLWGCYNVRARMALVTLAFFLVSNWMLDRTRNHKKGIIMFFLYSSIILELIFPVIYVYLYKTGFGTAIHFFGLAEKGLYSGREGIWIQALEEIDSVPAALFGIGSHQSFWREGLLNMHNNAMNLLVVVGGIGLLVYYFYIIYYINKHFDFDNAPRMKWQCLLFFIAIMIEGITDITLFYNYFLAYYFLPLGIALSHNYKFLE